MRIITRRDAIKKAIENWLEMYSREPASKVTGWNRSKTFGDAIAAVEALDPDTCTALDFDNASGLSHAASRWCNNNCDECDEDSDEVVRIGDEPDYEARWQDLCPGCLRKALAMVTAP